MLLFARASRLIQTGHIDEAEQLLTEVVGSVRVTLGDVRARAVTMGQIADILQARGQLDEALKIRNEEELPVYQRLGDVRSRAVTMGKIADMLQARGQLDEALKIRTEEQLPVFERLGDVRERAVTMGKIADILQARGHSTRRSKSADETLPVLQRLGGGRSRAVTMGKITDILRARGQLDEALRIYNEEQLPVYRAVSVTCASARSRWAKSPTFCRPAVQLDEALRYRMGRIAGLRKARRRARSPRCTHRAGDHEIPPRK